MILERVEKLEALTACLVAPEEVASRRLQDKTIALMLAEEKISHLEADLKEFRTLYDRRSRDKSQSEPEESQK